MVTMNANVNKDGTVTTANWRTMDNHHSIVLRFQDNLLGRVVVMENVLNLTPANVKKDGQGKTVVTETFINAMV